jgi:hypothetical protein
MTPTPPQQPDWRRYLLWAVIWVAFVAALGYAAKEGELDFLQNDVHLALEANRDRVALADKTPPVIEVKVSLRNNTKDPVTLSAASACKVFRWQIFARSGEMMQSKTNEESCPPGEVSAVLPSGQKVEEFYSIALETQRYRKGEDYQVRYWYWSYEGAFEFRAE